MTAGTTRAGRSALRRRLTPAALLLLATGLSALSFSLTPAPQAALAASPAASHGAAALITAGSFHSCAIESGKAYCWGDNGSGQLGNGSTVDSSVPMAVDTSGVLAGQALTQITAGDASTCALDAAGAAYCWGNNGSGQLGDGGTVSNSSVPVAVDTSGVLAGQTLTQITGDGYHTCVLDAAGAAYCWGDNGTGQLGDGGTAFDSSVPVAVDTSGVLAGQAVTQITAGWYDTCALDAAGAAFFRGHNADGELGNGSAVGSSVPVAVDTSGVLAGRTLTQVSARTYSAFAVDSAGAPYCWGANSWGQLGDNAATQSLVPALAGPQAPASVPPITGLTNATAYSIAVVARTTVGDSGASAAATISPRPSDHHHRHHHHRRPHHRRHRHR